MARRARGPVHAGIYHVWRRSAGPTEMFLDDVDRTLFCNRLIVAMQRYGWTTIAFALMTTHFHLILEVADDVLAPGMHALFGPYAQEFNRRHDRSGHLRAAPYKLNPIYDDVGLMRCGRYVFRNPVEAGLCAEPQDWLWSSYRGSAGYTDPFPFVDDTRLLDCFDENREEAIRLLRIFVETD